MDVNFNVRPMQPGVIDTHTLYAINKYDEKQGDKYYPLSIAYTEDFPEAEIMFKLLMEQGYMTN